MAAVDYLKHRGLAAQRVGSRVRLKPKALITEDVRKYVLSHRLELLAELSANDGVARRLHWAVILNEKVVCTMVGLPLTYDEALAVARWRWPNAEIRPRR